MTSYEGPRSIHDSELPELIDLLNYVFRPNGGDMGREYPCHVALSNRENVRIIKQEGQIVSHVATSVRPLNLAGIQTWEAGIGAVATHPNGRGKGYASILMQDAVKRSVEQGADIMLISGDLGVYRRMHAVDCGRFPVVKIGQGVPHDHPCLKVAKAQETDIDDICRLWETLPVRYMLPREDWLALLECKHIMDKPSDWWTVRLDGDLLGFGIVHAKGHELQLLDWAGHPDALDRAGSFWFHHYGVDTLIYIPPAMSLLPVSWRGHIDSMRCFDGTVLVIQARGFLDRARAFMEERIGEEAFKRLRVDAEAQRVHFELEGESVDFVDGGELALLFFGHPAQDILAEKLPVESKLRAMLSRMFPVPLVWYGVGYV